MTDNFNNFQDKIHHTPLNIQNLLITGYHNKFLTEYQIIGEIDKIERKIDPVDMYEFILEITECFGIKIIGNENILNESFSAFSKKIKLPTEINSNNFIKLYFEEIAHNKVLTHTEEMKLLVQSKQGDSEAIKQLILSNLKLVISIAKKFNKGQRNFLDLIQDGNLGLLKAIEKFNINKHNKFSTYATWWIKQSIFKSLADNSRCVRIPINILGQLKLFHKAQIELFQQNSRKPSQQDLQQYLGRNIKKIKSLEKINLGLSLDKYIGDDQKISLIDILKNDSILSPDEYTTQKILIDNLNNILSIFNEREVAIIKLRYLHEKKKTLEQIGKEFNITKERVRQIIQKFLKKVREHKGLSEMIKY